MPLPLHGIRIVDLTTMASGPLATGVLAEQGADVIKVEAPGTGDLIRQTGAARGGMSALFCTLNRNKRSLVLDLKVPRCREILEQLAAGADVFVQNFRPGVVDRLGIGADRMREINPALVYVSISGFGESGPYADRPVYDSIMQALSGFAAIQGDPATGVPELIRNAICDKSTALTTAQAITAALFARERGRGGQHLRLSMLDACIAILWPDGMQNDTFLGEPAPSAPMAASAFHQARPTADGWLAISAIGEREFQGLCRAMGRPELVSDPRFRERETRMAHIDVFFELVCDFTRQHTTEEVSRLLEAERVPFAGFNRPETLYQDPQVRASGVLVEYDHPTAGRMRAPRGAARFEGEPPRPPAPAPRLGEHGEEILGEIGIDPDEIADLRGRGHI